MTRAEDNKQIASTILSQLGGRMFVAMTGARHFFAGDSELQFSIGRNKTRTNKVRVHLNATDTYTVSFYYVRKRGLKVDLVVEHFGVYCDQLRSIFEDVTGLATSLVAR